MPAAYYAHLAAARGKLYLEDGSDDASSSAASTSGTAGMTGSGRVVLRSVQPLARRYEQDLLEELRRDGVAGQVLAIGPHSDIGADDEYTLTVPALDDPWLAPVWLGFAQLFALQRSAALGLTPDNPFPDGTVNRVVKGVTIHHG